MQKETQEISTKRKSGDPFRQASTMQERMDEREREREREREAPFQVRKNYETRLIRYRSREVRGKKKKTKDKKTKNNALRLSSFAIRKLDERNSLDDAGRI
jgi:hypothetical protein